MTGEAVRRSSHCATWNIATANNNVVVVIIIAGVAVIIVNADEADFLM